MRFYVLFAFVMATARVVYFAIRIACTTYPVERTATVTAGQAITTPLVGMGIMGWTGFLLWGCMQ